MKAFWDATGGHWMKQSLVGKLYGIMVSTGTQHGGQETTALATIPIMSHHGMIFVPTGFTHPTTSELEEVAGGSAYGATTIVGPIGQRMPSTKELELAEHHGAYFGKYLKRLN